MIQFVAQLDTTEEVVKKQLVKGSTNLNSSAALRQAYLTLEKIHQHGDLLTYINKTTAGCKPKHRSNDQHTNRLDNNRELRAPRSYFNPELVLKTHEGLPHRAGALVSVIGCLRRTSKDVRGPNDGLAAGTSTRLEPASCSAYLTL